MCLTIKWWCPACEAATALEKEFPCPAGQDCLERLLVKRPLERHLMEDWNCHNENCYYSVASEREFGAQVYAARALTTEGEGEGEAAPVDHQQMDVNDGYNSNSGPYETETLTVSVVGPSHTEDTASEESAPQAEEPRYPSPPPPSNCHNHTAQVSHSQPRYETPRLRAPNHYYDNFTQDNHNTSHSRKRARPSPSSSPTDSVSDAETEPVPPSPSSGASTIPNRLPLSHFHAINPNQGTAATWNLAKKTSRTPKGHKVDLSSLNPTLRHRIAELHHQNKTHYREGAEWSEGEKELLFLLKETLDFQTGNAMFGQDIYWEFFSYRPSTASQPHNMVEARANILRKEKGGCWWVQEERRPLLVLGLQPDGS
ncbi:hypothetical protein B0T14DRAFT_583552 [Immersiella caudata]|uniref:Uncharacterized protein n=1 Tax=Immersiella caudata TaxID=314043 RepID=A0AA39WZ92_9PEZI|nr:hypothetical protein B0T14DRAFT_583552 [Immersiella caudata]